MKKIDLMDITILIPVRLDSIIRIENLLASIESVRRNFRTNLYVLEASKYNNHLLEKLLPGTVRYFWVYDNDPVFYRTHYLNQLAQMASTPYLAIWDADIVLPKKQIEEAIETLRIQKCDVVYPYDGHFYDTTPIIREIYLKKKHINILWKNVDKMLLPYGTSMGGGAIFVNRESFFQAGMENEEFYGWGPEDWERLTRWNILGYNIQRIQGPLFHLSHPRDLNGKHNSDLQRRKSFFALRKMQDSSQEDIRKMISVELEQSFLPTDETGD